MDLESSTFIPSPDEHAQLKDEFVILVLRILTKHCKYFQQFANIVPAHIPHQYSKEMSRQSQVVSTKITTIKPLVQAQSPLTLVTKLICFSKLGWHRPVFVLQGNIAGTSLLVCSLLPLPPPHNKKITCNIYIITSFTTCFIWEMHLSFCCLRQIGSSFWLSTKSISKCLMQ